MLGNQQSYWRQDQYIPSSYVPSSGPGQRPMLRPVPFKKPTGTWDPNRPKFQKQSMEKRVLGPLTLDDGERLLAVWKSENYVEFNSWCQIARVRTTFDINENQGENPRSRKLIKNYTCALTLYFQEEDFDPLKAIGFGRNKKEAKRDAIEKIVIQLINNGVIHIGLRNRSFNYKWNKLQEQPYDMPSLQGPINTLSLQQIPKKVPGMDLASRRARKFAKRMQLALKEDAFRDACNALAQIVTAKKPDWNEVSFIWCYAVARQDLAALKTILDILVYKRFRRDGIASSNQSGQEGVEIVDVEKLRCDEKLSKKYGFTRLASLNGENPYEMIDNINLELNDVELDKDARQATTEDAEGVALENPFAKDLNGSLVHDDSPESRFGLNKTTPVSRTPGILTVTGQTAGQQYSKATPLAPGQQPPPQQQQPGSALYEPKANSIPAKLIAEMYEALLYCGNMTFALNVAETMYAKLKLDAEDFVNPQSGLYFANKKNQVVMELIESIYQVFSREKCGITDQLTSVTGTVEKIGNKYALDVLVLTPSDTVDVLESKVLKSWQIESRESFHQIAEGEFVLLLSFYPAEGELPADDVVYSTTTFAGYLNNMTKMLPQANVEMQAIYNSITEQGRKVEHAMIACVKELTKEMQIKLFALPNKEQSASLGEAQKQWKIVKLYNRTGLDHVDEALTNFSTQVTMSHLLLQIMLAPPGQTSKTVQELAETKVTVDIKPYFVNTNLNDTQQRALQSASAQLLTLIQGPPGSGKTTTAVEIVLEWLRQSPMQILACASNNESLDHLYGEFMKAGIKAIKIGPVNESQTFSDIRYKYYETYFNQKKYNHVANVRFSAIKKMLTEAQVICATTDGSTTEFLKGMKFTRVLIDEAASLTELDVLIPVTRNCQQLVLLGDHKSIGPCIYSSFVQSKGLGISLYERLVKQGIKPIFLSTQYHLHPTLSMFPSHQFYGNNLKDGVDDEQRPPITGFNWPNPLIRVAFIHVAGSETIHSSSIMNLNEVQAVTAVTMQILKEGSLKVNQLGIVTPYDAQNRRIRTEILHQAKKSPDVFGIGADATEHLNKYMLLVDVDTVDRYQNKEKELVIFSTVRSNKNGLLGFLRDPRKLNLALTRGRRGLIIVGNMDTLTVDPNWRDWLMWARANRIIVNLK